MKVQAYDFHRRRRPAARLTLRMVPMIDVIFLLLVFFLLTADFQSLEGFLPADLPEQSAAEQITEVRPLVITVESVDAEQCIVCIGTESQLHLTDDFSRLPPLLQDVMQQQKRTKSDPVQLKPSPQAHWDHVVKVYNEMMGVKLENIIFTLVD